MYEKAYQFWIELIDLSLRRCGREFCKLMIGRFKKSWVLQSRDYNVSWVKSDYPSIVDQMHKLKTSPNSPMARTLCLEIADFLSKYPPKFETITEKIVRLRKMGV